ncbi:MAG: ferrous iron transport protein B [Chloroflexi bacterium]|nr:ferrous iron transport protein B [Chloroflexota bacterium]
MIDTGQITIALAGNPNVGKSTIFNALTGSHQHVGNWPGKTVERKDGIAHIGDRVITVVDLPGTYSLNAYSSEEVIARDFIIHEHPQLVVAVADEANLERNLYLAIQILELEVPVILVLNMADMAHKRGVEIALDRLAERLGIPVIETVGGQSTGIQRLQETLLQFTDHTRPTTPVRIDYGPDLNSALDTLQTEIEKHESLSRVYPPRWLAIKLLENDEDLSARLIESGHQSLLEHARQISEQIADQVGDDTETLITDRRYSFISQILGGVLKRPTQTLETRSDQADRFVTHPIWGVPIFLVMVWLIFQFTANVSAPFLDWINGVISGPLTRWALALLGVVGLQDSWVEGLVVDGVIAGVGGVLVFVPVLFFLYLAVALLEDTGYMARSAFVMDRVMRMIGLHGKSFLPLMVGFGCTVPAIYATRTLEDENDRKLTAFLTPFMSCGARLPVYVVFGTAFFGAKSGNLIFAMYLIGIAVALLTGLALKRTVYRHKSPQPFMLELPPYRVPNMVNVLRQVKGRIKDFLRNATTIILASTIVIWFMLALPAGKDKGRFNEVQANNSIFGSLSQGIAPVFQPAGFGSWESAGSLITGFVAKEAVVGTMNLIYVNETASAADGESGTRFTEDMREIISTFGEASVLTVQETANIVPRTANLIPGVHLPEGDWLNQSEDTVNTSSLETALTVAFAHTAGSDTRGKLAAVAFNIFVLLYVPCMTTVAAMRHEFGARWMALQIAYTLALSWIAAVIVYQGGLLLGLA